LLAALGEQRERFSDARSLQCFSGIAPVVIRSGRSCWVKRRHACSKFVRQSFHQWAGESIRPSRWVRAYYEQQKRRGKKHHTVARSLAFQWQRIIWRCWSQRLPYNEETYMLSLRNRNPELYQLALTTKLPKDPKN
jgi:transposase